MISFIAASPNLSILNFMTYYLISERLNEDLRNQNASRLVDLKQKIGDRT
jgi:hypothetical protein